MPVLVALNLRDRHAFDMYRVDFETGATTLEATNGGDVLTWTTDNDFAIRAATAFNGKTAETIIRVRDAVDKPWRDLVVMPFERSFQMGQVVGGSLIAGFDPDGQSLVIHSALHSEKGRLVRVDLQSGKELSVVAQDPESDVADNGGLQPVVLRNPATHAIEAVEFNYTTRHWMVLDPRVQADFETIGREASGFLYLISRDHADRKWIVAALAAMRPRPITLSTATRRRSRCCIARIQLCCVSRWHRRGQSSFAHATGQLVTYLTTPPGVEAKNLPLVRSIHGGPWYRDEDEYEPEVQFLANRGYAVLQVNYRGSTGFGRQPLQRPASLIRASMRRS